MARVRKRTVEGCWSISVHDLLRGGFFNTSFEQPGRAVWRRNDREVSSVVFLSCRDHLRLRYRTEEGSRNTWPPLSGDP